MRVASESWVWRLISYQNQNILNRGVWLMISERRTVKPGAEKQMSVLGKMWSVNEAVMRASATDFTYMFTVFLLRCLHAPQKTKYPDSPSGINKVHSILYILYTLFSIFPINCGSSSSSIVTRRHLGASKCLSRTLVNILNEFVFLLAPKA